MASDNPKKDREINFMRDIVPTFTGVIESNKAFELGIRQRSVRSLNPSDIGRVFISVYANPKGYEDNTLAYHHVFPVYLLLDVDATHITAMNLFYVPRDARQKIVTGLLQRLNSTDKTNTATKSTFNYNLVKNNLQGAIIRPAIRKYIKDRSSQVVIQLAPFIWEQMYLGPPSATLEGLWSKTSSQRVYADFVREVLKDVNR